MKVFQAFQSNFAIVGINPIVAKQPYPFNVKIVLGILLLGSAIVCNLLYVIDDAETYAECTQTIYVCSVSCLVLSTLIITILKMKKIFEFINYTDELTNTRTLPLSALLNICFGSSSIYFVKIHFALGLQNSNTQLRNRFSMKRMRWFKNWVKLSFSSCQNWHRPVLYCHGALITFSCISPPICHLNCHAQWGKIWSVSLASKLPIQINENQVVNWDNFCFPYICWGYHLIGELHWDIWLPLRYSMWCCCMPQWLELILYHLHLDVIFSPLRLQSVLKAAYLQSAKALLVIPTGHAFGSNFLNSLNSNLGWKS